MSTEGMHVAEPATLEEASLAPPSAPPEAAAAHDAAIAAEEEAAEEVVRRLAAMNTDEWLTIPADSRWQAPPSDGLSLLEQTCFEADSELCKCREALIKLDAAARALVTETEASSPGHHNARPADFVRNIEERRELDDLMQQKMPAKIMVMGEMNSGKSMLINTMLRLGAGTKANPALLPSSNKPCTKMITIIKYSPLPLVKFVVPTGADSQHVSAYESQWTKELREGRGLHGLLGRMEEGEEAPPVPENVLQVELGLPLAVLRGGLEIVDSPGLGENEELNALVRSHIKYDPSKGTRPASAVIYVIPASAGGMKREDRVALQRVDEEARSRVMFVITKIDLLLQDQDEDEEEDALAVSLSTLFKTAQQLDFPLVVEYQSYERCPYFCPVSSKRANWRKAWGRELEPLFRRFEASFITLIKPALWAPLATSSHGLVARLSQAMSGYETYMLADKEGTEIMLADLKNATPDILRTLKEGTDEMKAVISDNRSSLHTNLQSAVQAFKTKEMKEMFLMQAGAYQLHSSVLANSNPTSDEQKNVSICLANHLQSWLMGEINQHKLISKAMQDYERKLVRMSTALGSKLSNVTDAKTASSLLNDTIQVTLMPVRTSTGDSVSEAAGVMLLGAFATIAGGGLVFAGEGLVTAAAWMTARTGVAAALSTAGGGLGAAGAALTGVGLAAFVIAAGMWVWSAMGPFDWSHFKQDTATKIFEALDASLVKRSLAGVPKALNDGFKSELAKNKERLEQRLQQEMHAWASTKAAFRSKLNELELLRAWATTATLPTGSPALRPFSGSPVLNSTFGERVQVAVVPRAVSSGLAPLKQVQILCDLPEDVLERQLFTSQLGSELRHVAGRLRELQEELELIAMQADNLPSVAQHAAKEAEDAVFSNAQPIFQKFTVKGVVMSCSVAPRNQNEVIARAKEAADARERQVIAEETVKLEARKQACELAKRSSFCLLGFFPIGSDAAETTPNEARSFRLLMRAPAMFLDIGQIIATIISSKVAEPERFGSVPLALAVHIVEDVNRGSVAHEVLVGTVSLVCFPFGSPPELQALTTANKRNSTSTSQAALEASAAWCIGILVHMMMTGGRCPFKPLPRYDGVSISEALRSGGCRPHKLPHGNALIERCLNVEPSKRPCLVELLGELIKLHAELMDTESREQMSLSRRLDEENTGFSLRLLDADKGEDGDVLVALQALLATKGEWLGQGADADDRWKHDNLQLKNAWRVEHGANHASYLAGVKRITTEVEIFTAQGVTCTPGNVPRDPVFQCVAAVNETMLLHGTAPERLLSLLSNGPSERFSGTNAGTMFGDGIYLAEDAGKSDQYCTVDHKYSESSELHKRLYGTIKHPGNVFYLLVCRTALGHSVRTQQCGRHAKSMDTAKAIFPVSFRELAGVPGVSPPKFYHSLVAEVGDALERYREFILFHGDQTEIEYVIAYQRCKGDAVVPPPAGLI